jgi:hypothetical protein
MSERSAPRADNLHLMLSDLVPVSAWIDELVPADKHSELDKAIATLAEYAQSFITHWVDDEDPEDHALALDAQNELEVALEKVQAMRAAMRNLIQATADILPLTKTSYQYVVAVNALRDARVITGEGEFS